VDRTNCGEFLGELRNCYLITKRALLHFVSAFSKRLTCCVPVNLKYDSILLLRSWLSRIIRGVLYENCILIYRTRILVVLNV